ncbi:MAG: Coenzyme F420 hydrogenase/dehydrogenase, beta subunit C-terminal domain [Candidatus Auribacterota bacterium]|nr:Coenzyme F420 hydrogenase/dehydrogenase, beta subunit C-terminal domain [Candidatus Auribacterota bacterium]
MAKVLELRKSADEGVRALLRFLLESGKVSSILTLTRISNKRDVAYSLITSSEKVKDTLPLYPLMPANLAKFLSRLTLLEPMSEPIAVVIRPCELRGFIELVKCNQGSLENILLISSTCGGVYPLEIVNEENVNEKISEYWEGIKNMEIPSDIRPTCKSCEHFLPYNADITIDLIGKENIEKKCKLVINTSKGEEFTDGMEGELKEDEIQAQYIDDLRNKRTEEKEKVSSEIGIEGFGLEGLINVFGKCIGCHGCREVCPICYCKLCYFDSRESKYEPQKFDAELRKKDGMRIPPDTVFFQVVRLMHISASCVGCGMCSDVCPADIPISTIFSNVGESVQNMFEYIPGKNVEEEQPLITFKEDEFADLEV